MTRFIALLRAVNVGGTGRLPMSALKAMCEDAGFASVATYIASGNVVFESGGSEAQVKAALEARLAAYFSRPAGVMVRTAAEMTEVLANNPFPAAPANRTMVVFLDTPPPPDAAEQAGGQADEEIGLGRREIYVHYPRGMGASKLRIPAAKAGTARNINTIERLVQMTLG